MTPFARNLWRAWDRVTIYLPVILMGLMALGTYWLARNTPSFSAQLAERAPTHEPDYFMRGFSVKSFDAAGRLKTEVYGKEARHYPDTDTMEVDQPRIRSVNAEGVLTVATADRAVSNGDASELQLIGHAVVTRDATPNDKGEDDRLQIRGEFLHLFLQAERVRSHKPVAIQRGANEFQADNLQYDHLERVLEMQGRVRGTIAPSAER